MTLAENKGLILTTRSQIGLLVVDVHGVILEDVVSIDPDFGNFSYFHKVDTEGFLDPHILLLLRRIAPIVQLVI